MPTASPEPTPEKDLVNDPLRTQVEQLLASSADEAGLEAVLDLLLQRFDCVVGTVHALDEAGELLHLRAQRGLPEALLGTVARIPVGKGMAGLAAERRAPVQVCNLQTDDSGVAKPGAKLTRMEGSVALPILVDGELRGSFGVAKPTPYEFDAAETELLLDIGTLIGRSFA